MPKFRKRPVVIEARQYLCANSSFELLHWINSELYGKDNQSKFAKWTNSVLIIPTLEGDHTAQKGDWIIKGIQGEFYPCKPDIFEATYELVEE